MKKLITIIFTLVLFVNISMCQDSKNDFRGMWTIKIEDGGVGWLHVFETNGYLDAELLWKGGSVVPVANVYLTDKNTLTATRTREIQRDENRSHIITQLFTFHRSGRNVSGTALSPSPDGMNVNIETFYGWKLPDVGEAPDLSAVKYGDPIVLFNGKNLDGWELIEKNKANGFKVIDGALVNDPVAIDGKRVRYGNIRTVDEFEDFKLTLEVNVPTHSNSGVYLRGMYEIQVYDSYGKELDSHNMGGLYSRVAPTQSAEKPGGEWQSMEIILCKRHVSVVLNGKLIIDNQPVYGPTGGAIYADVFRPGPIYLQGDHGKVSYRNIVLTPIIE